MAEPNSVIISSATFDLVEGLFDCEDLGFSTLKGLSRPIRLHRVRGESEAPSRLAARALRGLTPLVGREDNLAELLALWQQARGGALTLATISGEPGVGKSRLVAEVARHATADGAACIELRCSPFYENSALYPVIAYLKSALDFSHLTTPEERLDRIRCALTEAALPLGEMDYLLAALLDVPASLPSALASNPQRQKQKTQEMLIEWLRAVQKDGPLLLIVEDVQWADPSTRELIAAAYAALPSARLSIVLTYRQGYDTAWIDAHRPVRTRARPAAARRDRRRRRSRGQRDGAAAGDRRRAGRSRRWHPVVCRGAHQDGGRHDPGAADREPWPRPCAADDDPGHAAGTR